MLIREFLDSLKYNNVKVLKLSSEDILAKEVSSITYNSKEAKVGTLFVCKGVHFKPQYLNEAIKEGAVCYVSEKEYADVEIPCIIVDDIRVAMKALSESFYGPVYEKLKLTGITGTKGKSSTTYFVTGILDDYLQAEGRKKSCVLSTIRNYDGVIDEASHLTTPEIMQFYKHMNNAVENGLEYMTMEVSSQALKVDRVSDVRFDVGCFLNISPDHISPIEHPDFKDYFGSKLKLFKQCKIACVNCDCDKQEKIWGAAKDAESIVSFSQRDENANVYGYNVKTENGRTCFDVRGRGMSTLGIADFDEHIELASFGRLNVENALAAISIAICYGVPFKYIQSGLGRVVVPGRMELFKSADGKRIVVVDFAHNKLSFESLCKTMKAEFPGKNLSVVFGSPGGKAYARRKELGTIAGQNCVKSYITEDDPGEEDTEEICKEIANYMEAMGAAFEIILDRGEAIKKAIDEMDDGVLMVIGKGREDTMKRGNGYAKIVSDIEHVTYELSKY